MCCKWYRPVKSKMVHKQVGRKPTYSVCHSGTIPAVYALVGGERTTVGRFVFNDLIW